MFLSFNTVVVVVVLTFFPRLGLVLLAVSFLKTLR